MLEKDFDSTEEWWFYLWLLDAESLGYVKGVTYQPQSFQLAPLVEIHYKKKLKTKVKDMTKTLLQPHIYTADFHLEYVSPEFQKYFVKSEHGYWIDVKGTFNPHGGDRIFSIHQKWVYSIYKVYVNKIVPEKLFPKTWAPLSIIKGKRGKPLKKWAKCKTILDVADL